MRGAGSYVSIYALYFRFRPVGSHMPTCSRAGTDLWEVSRYRRTGAHDETIDTVFRFACLECGQVMFETCDGDTGFEHLSAANAGYGCKPVKAEGLWLWPGPPMFHDDQRGPTSFLVTRVRERPRELGDVVGAVGWYLHGPRYGLRWSAGLGMGDHGGVITGADGWFRSRGAAVKWIAQHMPPQPG